MEKGTINNWKLQQCWKYRDSYRCVGTCNDRAISTSSLIKASEDEEAVFLYTRSGSMYRLGSIDNNWAILEDFPEGWNAADINNWITTLKVAVEYSGG